LIQLSIIIINYKSSRLLLDCLKTVYAETSNTHFEVIVVDNDSRDGGKELLLDAFPDLRWIEMDYNAGFARANNEGIRQSLGSTILLLNPDTLVEQHAIDRCYSAFAESTFVACGVQLLNSDRTPQISGNYFMVGGLNYLLPLPYLGNFLQRIGRALHVRPPNVANAESVVEVDWINGAFLMAEKSAIEMAGLMDEDFFLYAEEAEWCYRLKKIGGLCLFGAIKVIHLQGETANTIFGSTGKGYSNLYNRKGLQIMLSNFVRIRKQFGVGWFLFNLFVYTVDIPIFFIGALLSQFLKKEKRFYSLRDVSLFCKNIVVIYGMSFPIISNKPRFYRVLV